MSEIDKLVAALTGEDEAAAEAAVSQLAEHGEASVGPLQQLIDSPDPEQRWWGMRALAAMPEPHTKWFLRGLGDAEPEVRAAAALALGTHPDEAAAEALVRLLSDDDSLVPVLAVNALVRLGASVVPRLIDAFESATPRGRIHLMRALAELRDHRAIRLMMSVLEDGSAALQYWAQQGLERLGLDMVYLRPD